MVVCCGRNGPASSTSLATRAIPPHLMALTQYGYFIDSAPLVVVTGPYKPVPGILITVDFDKKGITMVAQTTSSFVLFGIELDFHFIMKKRKGGKWVSAVRMGLPDGLARVNFEMDGMETMNKLLQRFLSCVQKIKTFGIRFSAKKIKLPNLPVLPAKPGKTKFPGMPHVLKGISFDIGIGLGDGGFIISAINGFMNLMADKNNPEARKCALAALFQDCAKTGDENGNFPLEIGVGDEISINRFCEASEGGVPTNDQETTRLMHVMVQFAVNFKTKDIGISLGAGFEVDLADEANPSKPKTMQMVELDKF